MFQITMPRFSPYIIIALLLLTGCDMLPPRSDYFDRQPLGLTSIQHFNQWLSLSHNIGQLDESEAAAELAGGRGRGDTPSEVFRYGLLNQQLNRLDGWIQARDAFRLLASDEQLEGGFRELASIFQQYNQAQINWHERHRNLQREVVATMLEREALEKKIEALTELETAISESRQQPGNEGTTDASDTGASNSGLSR